MLSEYKQILAQHVFDKAEALTGIESKLFTSLSRKTEYIEIRMAIYVALLNNGWTLMDVGRIFEWRNHSTIINARKQYNNIVFQSKQTGNKENVIELCQVLTKFIELNPFNENRNTKLSRALKLNALAKSGASMLSIVGVG